MNKTFKLLILITILFIIVGCDNKQDKKDTEIIENINTEELYLESIKSSKIEKLMGNLEIKSNLGKYGFSSKQYYEELKKIYDEENNEYAYRFIKEYEKIGYDSLSLGERDAVDYILKQLFKRKEIVKEFDIKNIWLIGYDNHNSLEDVDESGVGLLLNLVITKRESEVPDFEFYVYIKYCPSEKENVFNEYDIHLNVGDKLPLDTKLSSGKVKNKNYTYLGLKNRFDSLYNKKFVKLSEEDLNKIKEKMRGVLDVSTKYLYDRETLIEEHNFFDKKTNISGECNTTSKAESAIRADFENQLKSVKSRFNTVRKCEITHMEKSSDSDRSYSYEVKGNCSGYTDSYNQDYNIMTFDLRLTVNKSNCSVWGNVTNSKMKY